MKKIIIVAVIALLLVSLALSFCCCSYDCNTCQDKTEINCYDCNGKKQQTCPTCHGSGMRSCYLCNGTGRRRCMVCAGMGGSYSYDFFTKGYSYKPCYSCSLGYTTCPVSTACSCSGGVIVCKKCNDHGKIACPNCSSERE